MDLPQTYPEITGTHGQFHMDNWDKSDPSCYCFVVENFLPSRQVGNGLFSALYIPVHLIVVADELSRDRVPLTEWEQSLVTFRMLVDPLRPPQVDLFASAPNAKLVLFLSKVGPTPVGGLDALTVGWNQWNSGYLFPPPTTTIIQ